MEIPFVVVDVETTGGTAGRGDRIIEFAAVKVHGGEIVDTFSTLVNPARDIPPVITWLTGISRSMVSGAPLFAEIAPRVADFLSGHVFVAHNVTFDYNFVDMELVLADQGGLASPQLCTIKLARRVFPGLLHYNLGDLCRTMKVPLAKAHRAENDAVATAHLLIRMLKKLRACGFEDRQSFNEFYARSPAECAAML